MTALRTTSGVTNSKWDHRQSSTCLLLMSPWVQAKRPLQQSSPLRRRGYTLVLKHQVRGHTLESSGCQVGASALLMPSCPVFENTYRIQRNAQFCKQKKKKRLKIGPKVTSSFSAQEKEAKAVRGVWFSLNVICECAAMQTTEH